RHSTPGMTQLSFVFGLLIPFDDAEGPLIEHILHVIALKDAIHPAGRPIWRRQVFLLNADHVIGRTRQKCACHVWMPRDAAILAASIKLILARGVENDPVSGELIVHERGNHRVLLSAASSGNTNQGEGEK